MKSEINFQAIRSSLASFPSDHDAAGEHKPTVNEIFTPKPHANALDPNTPVVVGARGTGKSFWAGVLEQEDTRAIAAKAYPHLGLDRLTVRAGYTGFSSDGVATSKVIDARVPTGQENEKSLDFWQAVILKAAQSAINLEDIDDQKTIKELMVEFSDPEDAAKEIKKLDNRLIEKNETLLITFDALDTLSRDWKRSTLLLDSLFEVVWSLRARRCIRAKIFIRPEQLNDESLQFVELPKLRSGSVELNWSQTELYGLLYWRLLEASDEETKESLQELASLAGTPVPREPLKNREEWGLITKQEAQKFVMTNLAGPYMGRGNKKGGTYDWPYKHLADGKGKVTPRSFIKLFVEAAKYRQTPNHQAISADGIRHGLREASKVRVEQLVIEYKWVKRALAPLAGLTVPCSVDAIYDRWKESNTIEIILNAASDQEKGFMPPFSPRSKQDHSELLVEAMESIGLFSFRADGRIDIPDLFRVAALMLKKGGTTPMAR